MTGAADVTVPKSFGFDVFSAEDADELAGVGVDCVRVFNPACSTLLA